jgi:hypothetical protein
MLRNRRWIERRMLVGGLLQAIVLRRRHAEQLPAASHQGGQMLGLGIGHGRARELRHFGKARDHRRVDGIGLGQHAKTARQVAHLAGIDDPHRQAGRVQCRRHRPFQAAGRLHRHHLQRLLGKAFGQRLQSGFVTRYREVLARWQHMHIQAVLRDIDPHDGLCAFVHGPRPCEYGALARQATVRADTGRGSGSRLSRGARHQRANGHRPAIAGAAALPLRQINSDSSLPTTHSLTYKG